MGVTVDSWGTRSVGRLRPRLIQLLIFFLAAAFALTFASCDSGEDFTYVNETTELLYVQVNDGSSSAIEPGETRTISHLTSRIGTGDDPLKFVVRDADGCLVLERQTALRDFKKEQDLTFRIVAAVLTPPEERSQCDTLPSN